jgi:lipid II:glycine glycyltransferase (peptidoglycan interpeptide bridge formation enzyme)
MGRILENNNINREKWRDAVNSDFASPFQTPEYYDTINQIEGYSAEAFAYEENEELKIISVLVIYKEKGVKAFFSKRAILYGGPLLSEVSQDEFSLFLSELKARLKSRVIYIEIRNFFDYSKYDETFKKKKWDYLPYVNLQLDLKDQTKETILKKFKYNRRREIKQSISNDASYNQTNDLNDAMLVYNILEDLYKERVKLPIPPFSFFKKQIEKGIIKVFIVKHDGIIIGGSYCPVLDKKGIYTFYYCGAREYHKTIFPTHLAVLAAMEYAIENDIPRFDFMGAGLKDEKYGVRSYKKAFGGELVEHGRYIKILKPRLYKIGKFGLKILAKIK